MKSVKGQEHFNFWVLLGSRRHGFSLLERALQRLVVMGVVLSGAAGVVSATALAQTQESSRLPDPSSTKTTRTDAQGRKITVVDFDDARIEGNIRAPDGFVLRSRDSAKAQNILNLRKNFHRRIRAVGHEGLRAVPMN